MTTTPAAPADPRYPIGRWTTPDADPATLAALLDALAEAPAALRTAVHGLDDARLDTPYRDGGWTVRQLVHHVADSHLHAYLRMKLALTADPDAPPTIVPYDENRWTTLADVALPVEPSLALLDALHARWTAALRPLGASGADAWDAHAYLHPEMGRVSLRQALGIYAWHGRHHTAHVTALRARMGW